MMTKKGNAMKMALVALLALAATPASAQDAGGLRQLCSDRPGLDTPACTVDKGHLQLEVGIGDWTLDRQRDSRTDTIQGGDVAARLGVTDTTELRLEWTAYGHVRARDRPTGTVDRMTGIGDVTVGIKQNLSHPDGDGFSLALLPFATLPSGGEAIGAGTWSAGLVVPITYQLNEMLTLENTPEVDAAADGDRHGRHLAYSDTIGLGVALTKALGVTAELQALRDRDPDGHETMALGGLSLAWQPKDRMQLDVGANAGLNRATPDIELYFGVTEKF